MLPVSAEQGTGGSDAQESDRGGHFRLRSESHLHSWAWWSLVSGDFEAPDGERFTRTWVRSPGAVGVVALDDHDRVILVRQFRPAVGEQMWEVPAGLRDVANEDPADTAARELREEVGLTARRWTALGRIVSAPGISDSDVLLYLARDLAETDTARHGPEEQHMTAVWFSLARAVTMVDRGEITDSKTVAGLLWASRLV